MENSVAIVCGTMASVSVLPGETERVVKVSAVLIMLVSFASQNR